MGKFRVLVVHIEAYAANKLLLNKNWIRQHNYIGTGNIHRHIQRTVESSYLMDRWMEHVPYGVSPP